jgi:hypothetical protein
MEIAMQTAERIENLWGSFDTISAELVKAKRALREGRGSEQDVTWLRVELMDIAAGLAELGEMADPTEPGD